MQVPVNTPSVHNKHLPWKQSQSGRIPPGCSLDRTFGCSSVKNDCFLVDVLLFPAYVRVSRIYSCVTRQTGKRLKFLQRGPVYRTRALTHQGRKFGPLREQSSDKDEMRGWSRWNMHEDCSSQCCASLCTLAFSKTCSCVCICASSHRQPLRPVAS